MVLATSVTRILWLKQEYCEWNKNIVSDFEFLQHLIDISSNMWAARILEHLPTALIQHTTASGESMKLGFNSRFESQLYLNTTHSLIHLRFCQVGERNSQLRHGPCGCLNHRELFIFPIVRESQTSQWYFNHPIIVSVNSADELEVGTIHAFALRSRYRPCVNTLPRKFAQRVMDEQQFSSGYIVKWDETDNRGTGYELGWGQKGLKGVTSM
jgi:hypothetical protein